MLWPMSEPGRSVAETSGVSLLRHVDAGEWEHAIERAGRTAGGVGPLPARTAWPVTMVLYLQGELDVAESVLARSGSTVDEVDETADRALLAAWAASVEWARGDVSACRRDAGRALSLAQSCGEPRPLAAAHTVLALLAAMEGDRRSNDRHYALALDAAVRAGDRTQQLRIRANRASQRLEEGDLAGALTELDEALGLVADDPGPHPAMVGLAQHNRADLLLRSGRLVAARDGFRAARTTLQRVGTGTVAYPLTGLGECHELRGDLPQARAAYEEAVLVARATGITQALVPALCGLARVLAATGDAAARPTAAQAVAASTGLTEAAAHVAAGWAALATDPTTARDHAETAITLARAGRTPAALADGLELAAMTYPPGGAEPLLADAERVWADIGDPVAVARVALTRARTGAGRVPAAAHIIAEDRLRMLDVDPSTGTRSLARPSRSPDNEVSVRMLGSFAVLHNGEQVPVKAWQSRKARDLLKLLVARRGRPITREALGEALWPGENSIANRLSITLSVLRAVLDPARTAPPDHYVVAGPAGVAYNPHTLPVDVDIFLQLAAAGTIAAGTGRPGEARMLLAAADAAYTGDVLDDEPDLEAVMPLRDEARTTYLATMRALGTACAEAGDADGAVRAWLRLLEHDPYDEDAALRLVELLIAAGRHGEAARHHRRYTERMRELGVAAAPMPQLEQGHSRVVLPLHARAASVLTAGSPPAQFAAQSADQVLQARHG
jgi:DNA-binding SARP family transcriptional activator